LSTTLARLAATSRFHRLVTDTHGANRRVLVMPLSTEPLYG